MKQKQKPAKKVSIVNKKAKFEYSFIETYTAGIILTGTEIKSIRMNNANISDAFCYVHKNTLVVKNMYIAEYTNGSYNNHEPRRDRTLLVNKKEITKIEKQLIDQGVTMIPYKLFITDRGFAKLEIAIAKGKKLHDKRESLKEKDTKREFDRIKKMRR